MLTLATSFVNKPLVIQVWLECFKLLDMPKNETKLVWIDMAENQDVSHLLQKYIKEHGKEWRQIVYLKSPVNDSDNKILNLINSHREGDLLLWEYDTIVPPNAYQRLRSVFNESDRFAGVTGVQYYKEIGSSPRILAWNFEKAVISKTATKKKSSLFLMKDYIFYNFKYKGFPISFALIRHMWETKSILRAKKEPLLTYKDIPINLKTFGVFRNNVEKYFSKESLSSESLPKLIPLKEKGYGVEEIGASDTGFILYRSDFLNSHVFKSQDYYGSGIMLGITAQKKNRKIMICWDLKFPHLDENNKSLDLYYSILCKTKINGLPKYHPDYHGNKIFGIGLEKTGTTSLHRAFQYLGLSSLHYYNMNKYQELIKKTRKEFPDEIYSEYQAFSDGPFFKIFKELDKEFPHSKFVWTQRGLDSWLTSIQNHSERSPHEWKKFNRDERISEWNEHNKSVRDYFKNRPDDLLVLDIINGDGWERLCPFLQKKIPSSSFPHLNKAPQLGSNLLDRGIITMAFGKQRFIDMAKDLAKSIKFHSPQISLSIVTDSEDSELKSLFNFVIPLNKEFGENIRQKHFLNVYTPYKKTVFLDCDSLAVRDITFIFDRLDGKAFAPIRGKYLVRGDQDQYMDVNKILDHFNLSTVPKYNGGFYYFEKTPLTESIYKTGQDMMANYLSIGFKDFKNGGPNDEALMSVSMTLHGLKLAEHSGDIMVTPLGIQGDFDIDVIAGKSTFNKGGNLVAPAIVHFTDSWSDHPVYSREVSRIRKAYAESYLANN